MGSAAGAGFVGNGQFRAQGGHLDPLGMVIRMDDAVPAHGAVPRPGHHRLPPAACNVFDIEDIPAAEREQLVRLRVFHRPYDLDVRQQPVQEAML